MSILKKTKPSSVKLLYQLLYNVSNILENNNIPYFIEGGTLLGSIRHKGIIPWDDDLDIGIFKEDIKKFLRLSPQFAQCGYSIVKLWFGYKIFITRRKHIPDFNYSYPFLDVFIFKKHGRKYINLLSEVRKTWPKAYFYKTNLFPLKRVKFGDFYVFAPAKSEPILNRVYGKDWNKIAYRQYDHAKEESLIKKKVVLTPKDRVPAMPTMIKRKKCVNKMTCRKTCVSNKFYRPMGAYVINCDIHTKRLAKFRKYAKKAGIHFCRIPCVNGKKYTKKNLCDMIKKGKLSKNANVNKIEIAINYSHLNIWKRIIHNCEEYGIVCEDDTEIRTNFLPQVNNILKKLDKNGIAFDILFLWNGNWNKSADKLQTILRIDRNITIVKETTDFNAGAVSYIISRQFANELVENFFPINYTVDIYMSEIILLPSYQTRSALSVKMSYNKLKECYISPLFRTGKWICGGAYGTGQSSQNYSLPNIDKIKC